MELKKAERHQSDVIRDICSSGGTKRKRILGVSGTGKTHILIESVKRILKNNPNARILVTYFNASLQKHISLQLMEDIVGNHSLGVTDRDGKISLIERMNQGEVYTPLVVHAHRFLENAHPGKIIFDYIFIDEVQDMEPEIILRLSNFLAIDGKLCVFGDKRQRLYDNNKYEKEPDRKKSLTPSLPSNLCFKGPWTRLNYQFRQSTLINALAEEYAKSIDEHYGSEENIPAGAAYGGQVKYVSGLLRHKLDEFIKGFLASSKWKERDTAILSNNNENIALFTDDVLFRLTKTFTYTGQCKTDFALRQNLRMEFDANKKGLKLSSVCSFKGLEIDNVIFIHDVPDQKVNDEEESYVALTRARKRLLIIDLCAPSSLEPIYGKYAMDIEDKYKRKRLVVL